MRVRVRVRVRVRGQGRGRERGREREREREREQATAKAEATATAKAETKRSKFSHELKQNVMKDYDKGAAPPPRCSAADTAEAADTAAAEDGSSVLVATVGPLSDGVVEATAAAEVFGVGSGV